MENDYENYHKYGLLSVGQKVYWKSGYANMFTDSGRVINYDDKTVAVLMDTSIEFIERDKIYLGAECTQ